MALNWTIEVIMYFIAAGICGFATLNAAFQYTKRHERHVLWLMIACLSGCFTRRIRLFISLFAFIFNRGIVWYNFWLHDFLCSGLNFP